MLDRSWTSAFHLPADVIQGGTAISGIYNLAPVAASFQNDILQLTADEIETFSPLLREFDIQAPVIATVGGNETSEFLRQTADFARALAREGTSSRLTWSSRAQITSPSSSMILPIRVQSSTKQCVAK